ncbi:MAG TPA: hypothetical protein PK677_11210, partial [Acidiphilium sp.]|nr:hypothetical protein [Acidiphilium sp.]
KAKTVGLLLNHNLGFVSSLPSQSGLRRGHSAIVWVGIGAMDHNIGRQCVGSISSGRFVSVSQAGLVTQPGGQ